MPTDHLAAQPVETSEESAIARHLSQQRMAKLALFLASVVFSAAAFLAFDWLRSAAIRRSNKPPSRASSCRAPDPVRHHSFIPNCAAVRQWGPNHYQFFTNNLGFRDEKIRDVPLADARPRILLLGDSFTEGMIAWQDSYAGKIAARLPQYDFLNGGVASYSPSNYFNTARLVLAKGVQIDEVLVFIDLSDVQDEAAFYRDVDSSGAVTALGERPVNMLEYAKWRARLAKYLMLSSYIFQSFEQFLVRHGSYHHLVGPMGDVFDMERAAWTYRSVNETYPANAGYGPLGVEGGIARERDKMTLLWQELEKRHIPLSIVVYPYPAQLVHDTQESQQVRIWRDWCQGRCKRFISLFPAFFAVKLQCPRSQPGCWYMSLFIFGDFHFNPVGNALVADSVIRSLTESPPAKRQLPP
jgi:hypothetical protein